MIFILRLIEFSVIIATITFLVAFIHELGHALVMLIVFKGPITMHIGSFGVSSSTISTKLGRLHIYISYNPALNEPGVIQLK
jgi:hypothetical protein